MITLRQIAETTAQHMDVSVHAMRTGARTKSVTAACKVAWAVARKLTEKSLQEIANWHGRSCHTTILKGSMSADDDTVQHIVHKLCIENPRVSCTGNLNGCVFVGYTSHQGASIK